MAGRRTEVPERAGVKAKLRALETGDSDGDGKTTGTPPPSPPRSARRPSPARPRGEATPPPVAAEEVERDLGAFLSKN